MEKFIISALRQSFIEDNFFQWSFNKPDDFLPEKSLFEQISHPAELHYLAHIYNWDDGSLVLEWLLDSSLCTKSTANLLFWRAAPDYYLECDLNDESTCEPYNLDGFRVIKKSVGKVQVK